MLKLRTDIKYISPEGKLTQAGVEAFQGQIDALSADPSGLTVSSFAASAIVTEAEGIAANDVDTALPTSAAVKDYADATVMPTVAAAAVDAIGAYALLRQTTTSTARSPGDIVAGANLRYESVAGNGAGSAPPGNWMICGAITSGAGNTTNTSLWRRVS